VVVGDGEALRSLFDFHEGTHKSPSFDESANPAVSACVPRDEGCDNCTDKRSLDRHCLWLREKRS